MIAADDCCSQNPCEEGPSPTTVGGGSVLRAVFQHTPTRAHASEVTPGCWAACPAPHKCRSWSASCRIAEKVPEEFHVYAVSFCFSAGSNKPWKRGWLRPHQLRKRTEPSVYTKAMRTAAPPASAKMTQVSALHHRGSLGTGVRLGKMLNTKNQLYKWHFSASCCLMAQLMGRWECCFAFHSNFCKPILAWASVKFLSIFLWKDSHLILHYQSQCSGMSCTMEGSRLEGREPRIISFQQDAVERTTKYLLTVGRCSKIYKQLCNKQMTKSQGWRS